jgi:hypothetical protein
MADQQPAPDFDAIAASMNIISNEHASVALELGRMQNLPALDAGARILDAITELSRRMDERFEELSRRMDERFDETASRLDSM